MGQKSIWIGIKMYGLTNERSKYVLYEDLGRQ